MAGSGPPDAVSDAAGGFQLGGQPWGDRLKLTVERSRPSKVTPVEHLDLDPGVARQLDRREVDLVGQGIYSMGTSPGAWTTSRHMPLAGATIRKPTSLIAPAAPEPGGGSISPRSASFASS
jgi:hypothetical protein